MQITTSRISPIAEYIDSNNKMNEKDTLGVSTIGKRSSHRRHRKVDSVEQTTLKVLEYLEEDSPFFDQNPPSTLPIFSASGEFLYFSFDFDTRQHHVILMF